jgi:hypothetical protein
MNDDEALVEKQRVLSEKALESVSMKPLAEILAKRLGRIPAKPEKYTPTPSRVPPWQGIRQRRFLIVKSKATGGSVNIVWVDDDETCTKDYGPDFDRAHTVDDEGFIERKDWHTYTMISQFRKTNVFAIRCPASLTFDERQKIEFDEPPGHYEQRLRSVTKERREKSTSGGKIEEEETFL